MTCNCIGGNPCPCQMGRIAFGPRFTAADFPPPNVELLDLLAKAKLRVMTPKEIYEQKVSWLIGMTGKLADPPRSREEVVKALADLGIVDPEPSAQSDIHGEE